MSKILISPLGAGALERDGSKSTGKYRTAVYKIDEQEYDSSFVASVLYEHFGLDEIIFIGTVKSMWEEVYSSFCAEKGITKDEKYWKELSHKIDVLDRHSPLDSLDLKPVETVLGKNSHCILIRYGLNESELWQNFDKIFEIVQYLDDGDELYIDITHSFRSLSMFLFLVLTFISNLSEKRIKVAGIYYGMLDVISELKYAPIVDLKSMFELTDWIKGTHSLKSYGNGYLIADLLDSKDEPELAKQIRNFSHIVNLNYLAAIKYESIALADLFYKKKVEGPFKHIQYILENFIRRFAKIDKDSFFQVELAGWYFENKRFATGYITLQESIVTYLCEKLGRNPISRYDRDEMKNVIHKRHYKKTALAQCFFHINDIRKTVAHSLPKRAEVFYKDAITALKYQSILKEIYKSSSFGEKRHLKRLKNLKKMYYRK